MHNEYIHIQIQIELAEMRKKREKMELVDFDELKQSGN